ncbi:Elongation factor 4 [Streptomyces tendae]
MDIERERGITIKSQAVRLPWAPTHDKGATHILNMIDTPGHVDFTYKVSRSLAACEGTILLVDAAQGIEAQTLANLYLAMENDLTIIPVLNKIDLPAAQPEKFAEELANLVGCDPDDVLKVSAKTGLGVDALLDKVVAEIPAPVGVKDAPARAMIFDSVYDSYRGVVTYVRVIDGQLNKRERIRMMSTGATHELLEIGTNSPEMLSADGLGVGEVGYLITGVKDVRQSKVGDTVTSMHKGAQEALGGYKDPRPMVFSGLYPLDGSDYPELREALDKLQLNDAALVWAGALRRPRLRLPRRLPRPAPPRRDPRAAGARVRTRPHRHRAQRGLPRGHGGRHRAHRHQPERVPRGQDQRGLRAGRSGHDPRADRVHRLDHGAVPDPARHPARHGLPLRGPRRDPLHPPPRGDRLRLLRPAEVQDPRLRLAGLQPTGEQTSSLVKVDILLHGDKVDAFSAIAHKDAAYAYGVRLVAKLRELIPRQAFEVPIQAAIGSRVIARETIRAIRKDVLAKCYGGDISRKRKLLEKQKEGKKRMKMVGSVEVPQEAFIAVLSSDDSAGSGKGKK